MMHRKSALPLIMMLFFFSGCGSSPVRRPQQSGQQLTVSLLSTHPTQMQVGLAAVKVIEQVSFIDRAIGTEERLADFKSYHGHGPRKSLSMLTSAQRDLLRKRLIEYLDTSHPKPLRAIRAPNGDIYITDGHHRTTALALLSAEGTPPILDPTKIQVLVHIDDAQDFSGRQDEFEKYVAAKGYFSRELRERFERHEVSAAQLVQSLPKNFRELSQSDSPIRSTIGRIFFDFGFEADHFVEYIEFLVGDKVACEAGSSAGHEYDEDVLERTRRAIWGQTSVLNFIRSKELPVEQHRLTGEAEIEAAVKKFNSLEQKREEEGVAPPPPSQCSLHL